MPQYRLGEGPYGSAYRGTIDDLVGCGDLAPSELAGRTFGLFVGRFDYELTIRHSWKEPARGIWAWMSGYQLTRVHTEVIPLTRDLRFTGDQHHLTVAMSGAGKFRDVISNMLLYDGSCETACLIIDPKGEIASITGPIVDGVDDADPRTVLLDPWDLCGTGATDSLTLLDGIRSDNPHCVKDARVLAEAIIIERSTEDGHWAATATNFLAALLLYLGLDPLEKDARNLFRLRQIVTLPWSDFADLLGYMTDSTFVGGVIARAAQAMLNREEKERRAVLSTLERDTAFIEDPGLWKAIKTSSFDMADLVLSNKRLHVVVPFDYTEQMKSWLRLTIATFYNACLRHQLPRDLPRYLQFRHIIIDEFAGLGKLDFIMKGIAEARGAGIKYHLSVQNFAQLNVLYKEGWENLVSNSFIQAFGTNDNFTADYLSKMTGQATVVTESKSFSNSTTFGTSTTTGTSSTSGHLGSSTSGSSKSTTTNESRTFGTSTTFSSTGRAVLTPDEIRRVPEGTQLLFLRQMPVLMTKAMPYFEVFAQFLPDYELKDVLAAKRKANGVGMIRALTTQTLRTAGRRANINSGLVASTFKVPSPRSYSFREALLQSPGFLASAFLAACFVLWFIPHELFIQMDEASARSRYERQQQLAAQQAQERDLERQRETELAQEADANRNAHIHDLDAKIAPLFKPVADTIFSAIESEGLCAGGADSNPAFSCGASAKYQPGQLSPLVVDANKARKQFLSLSVSEANTARGDGFNGVLATMTIRTVYDYVNLNDGRSVDPAFHRTAKSVLDAFGVPNDVLASCIDNRQGVSVTVPTAIITCRSAPRTASGDLAQFTMTVARRLGDP